MRQKLNKKIYKQYYFMTLLKKDFILINKWKTKDLRFLQKKLFIFKFELLMDIIKYQQQMD